MNRNHRTIAEYAFVLAIPKFFKDIKKCGRLRNLLNRLKREGEKAVKQTAMITEHELKRIIEIVSKFHSEIGWGDGPTDILNVVSFGVGLVQMYDIQVTECLNDIIDYYERAGNWNPAMGDEGLRAEELWEKIVEEATI